MSKSLNQLLKGLEYRIVTEDSSDVLSLKIPAIVYDRRQLSEGCLFFCCYFSGRTGPEYLELAIEKGAKVIVLEESMAAGKPFPKEIVLVFVKDARYAMACMYSAWYDHPSKKMTMIGVTGTKGKTSITYFLKRILERAGRKVGLIGTIETIIGQDHIPSVNTTPEPPLLQSSLARMAEEGIDAVVMEVSSQALKYERSEGILFDIGIFTNISPDHIGKGMHTDFADYLSAKSRLFRQCRVGIVNADEPLINDILLNHTCSIRTYGIERNADLRALDIRSFISEGELGVSFRTKGLKEMDVSLSVPGKFSVLNALAAILCAIELGTKDSVIVSALKDIHVRGRMERVPLSRTFTVLIDYAHNSFALETLLSALRQYHPKRLICVFGCGGSSAVMRRRGMGEVSGRLADFTILTSDNPRFEDPREIIEDILSGLLPTGGRYSVIPDRKEAIASAIRNREEGDLIVIAGKGHETFQEIQGIKYPMEDRALVLEAWNVLQKEKDVL